jgi:hypothetical protein
MIDVIDTIFINQLFLTKTCSRSQEIKEGIAVGVKQELNGVNLSYRYLICLASTPAQK